MSYIGNSVIESTSGGMDYNIIMVERFEFPSACYVIGLEIYANISGSTALAKGVIYTDKSGPAPDALLITGTELSLPSGTPAAWQSLAFSSPYHIASSGYYWIGLLCRYPALQARYRTTDGTYTLKANTYADGAPDPYGAAGIGSRRYSIRAVIMDAPAAPTLGTVTRNSTTQATVNWTNNPTTQAPYTDLDIWRSTDGGSMVHTYDPSPTATQYVDNTLSATHAYQYKVKVLNSAGYAYSSTSAILYGQPAAPSGISAHRENTTQNHITWTNNPTTWCPYSTLTLEYNPDGAGWQVISSSLSPTTTAYWHTASASVGYLYRVKAVGVGGTSSYNSTTVETIIAPTAPSNMGATRVSDTQVTVTWTNNSNTDGPYSSIHIYRSTDGGAYTEINTGVSGSATNWSDTTTSANHYYNYKAQANNTAGSSTAGTGSSTVYMTPSAPSGCVITQTGETEITVDWNDNSITEQYFELYRTDDGGSNWDPVSTSIAANTEQYVNGSLPDATYSYKVRAKRGTLYSSYSSVSNEITIDTTPPAVDAIGGPAMIQVLGVTAQVTTELNRPPQTVLDDFIKIFDPDEEYVIAVKANVQWTTRLEGSNTLDSVTIPANYLKQDGVLESRLTDIVKGWYIEWTGDRYIVDDVSVEYDGGLVLHAVGADADLANYYTNYSPGTSMFLNHTPSEILSAAFAGHTSIQVKNSNFSILDENGAPTNWGDVGGLSGKCSAVNLNGRTVIECSPITSGTSFFMSDPINCVEGHTYQFVVDILAGPLGGGTAGLGVRWIKADGSYYAEILGYADETGQFETFTPDPIVAKGVKFRVYLRTYNNPTSVYYDTLRVYDIGPDPGWTYQGEMDTRGGTIDLNDGATSFMGTWTQGADYISSDVVGNRAGRIINGPLVVLNFGSGGTDSECKVYVNGVEYQDETNGSGHLYRVSQGNVVTPDGIPINVSSARVCTITGLDPNSDHIVDVEVVSGTVIINSMGRVEENLISMQWDFLTLFEALAAVKTAVGGEFWIDTLNKVIYHRSQVGRDLLAINSVVFRKGHNIISFKKSVDRSKIVNQLIYLGYGDGDFQLSITVDATSKDGDDNTSQDIYGVRRGTYTNKDCKSRALALVEAKKVVEESCWPTEAFTVVVTDESAGLCCPGDTAWFYYDDDTYNLRILEISRDNQGSPATLAVSSKTKKVADYIASNRQELQTLQRSYQGVPSNDNFSFTGTFTYTTSPYDADFYIPYNAKVLSLKVRYHVTGSPAPSNTRVYLDSALIADLNGLTSIADFDLMPYVTLDSNGNVSEGWHTLSFQSSTSETGTASGTVFLQQFIQTSLV